MSCPKKLAAAEIAPGGVVGDLVVTFPDRKFGYRGVTNDRDSLDRLAMDHTLPDRMRAAIVKGKPTARNPDLTMLFGHIDVSSNGYLDMHEAVNYFMKYDALHPTIADCEKIFYQVAQGAHDLSLERWLDWLSGRKTASDFTHGEGGAGPSTYSSPSCPTLGWRALAGVNVGNKSYDVVSRRLRQQLAEKGAQVKRAFREFDTNNNGLLDREEFQRGLNSFGCDVSEDQLFAVFRDVDADGSGVIDFREFATWLHPPEENAWMSTASASQHEAKRAAEVMAASRGW